MIFDVTISQKQNKFQKLRFREMQTPIYKPMSPKCKKKRKSNMLYNLTVDYHWSLFLLVELEDLD